MTVVPPYEAIRNLLGTYCRIIDSGDFVALGELFADAVLLDDQGRVAAKGAEAATALWTGLIKRYEDGTPKTRHTTTNPVIELAADGTAVDRDIGGGDTRVTLTQTGYGQGAGYDALWGFFHPHNAEMLETLKKSFETQAVAQETNHG